MDFEIGRCSRKCAASGKALAEGEVFYSALVADGAGWKRLDYAVESWQGPPPNAIGWWRSRLPHQAGGQGKLAPNEVLLKLFHELAGRESQTELRYVLALLLVRRRVLRIDVAEAARFPGQIALYCPRDEETYHVPEAVPTPDRAALLQEQLRALLAG